MKKARGLLPVVAVAAALLSGCANLHPGVAAQVGDQSISMSTVDDTADAYCRAIEKQLTGNAQVVPQNFFRSGVAGTLALRAAASQLADDYGVKADKVYQDKVADLQQQVAPLPEDVQDAVVTIESGQAYVSSIQEAVGRAVLEDQGTSDPGYTEAADAGKQRFTLWLSQHDVDFDPSLNVSIADGTIGSTDDSVSYALGTQARGGSADTPDDAYSRSLPSSHRCG